MVRHPAKGKTQRGNKGDKPLSYFEQFQKSVAKYGYVHGRIDVKYPHLAKFIREINSDVPFVPIRWGDEAFSQILHPAFDEIMASDPLCNGLLTSADYMGIKTAVPKKPKIKWINGVPDLKDMIKELKQHKVIFCDLEAHGIFSYRGITATIQLYAGGSEVFIVDTLRLFKHVRRLNQVFMDKLITKVFYAATQDIIALQRDFGVYVVGLLDLQVLVNCTLTHTKLSHGCGLATAVEKATGKKVSKTLRICDFRLRPLPKKIARYAAMDCYVLPLLMQYLLKLPNLNMENSLAEAVVKSRSIALKTFTKKLNHASGATNDSSKLVILEYMRDLISKNEDVKPRFFLPDRILERMAKDGWKARKQFKDVFTKQASRLNNYIPTLLMVHTHRDEERLLEVVTRAINKLYVQPKIDTPSDDEWDDVHDSVLTNDPDVEARDVHDVNSNEDSRIDSSETENPAEIVDLTNDELDEPQPSRSMNTKICELERALEEVESNGKYNDLTMDIALEIMTEHEKGVLTVPSQASTRICGESKRYTQELSPEAIDAIARTFLKNVKEEMNLETDSAVRFIVVPVFVWISEKLPNGKKMLNHWLAVVLDTGSGVVKAMNSFEGYGGHAPDTAVDSIVRVLKSAVGFEVVSDHQTKPKVLQQTEKGDCTCGLRVVANIWYYITSMKQSSDPNLDGLMTLDLGDFRNKLAARIRQRLIALKGETVEQVNEESENVDMEVPASSEANHDAKATPHESMEVTDEDAGLLIDLNTAVNEEMKNVDMEVPASSEANHDAKATPHESMEVTDEDAGLLIDTSTSDIEVEIVNLDVPPSTQISEESMHIVIGVETPVQGAQAIPSSSRKIPNPSPMPSNTKIPLTVPEEQVGSTKFCFKCRSEGHVRKECMISKESSKALTKWYLHTHPEVKKARKREKNLQQASTPGGKKSKRERDARQECRRQEEYQKQQQYCNGYGNEWNDWPQGQSEHFVGHQGHQSEMGPPMGQWGGGHDVPAYYTSMEQGAHVEYPQQYYGHSARGWH